jgi:hypothetical protein
MLEFSNGKVAVLPTSDIKERLVSLSKEAKEISMMSTLKFITEKIEGPFPDEKLMKKVQISASLKIQFHNLRNLAGFFMEDLDEQIKRLLNGESIANKKPVVHFSEEAYSQFESLLESINMMHEIYAKLEPPEEAAKVDKLYKFFRDARWLEEAVDTLESRIQNQSESSKSVKKERRIVLKNSTLLYGDKTIKLKKDTAEYMIMKYLLKNKIKKHIDYDVIYEDYDENYSFTDSRRPSFYHVCKRLNDKIKSEFGITDYLDYTTLTVRINK